MGEEEERPIAVKYEVEEVAVDLLEVTSASGGIK